MIPSTFNFPVANPSVLLCRQVREYRHRGFAVTAIRQGEKRPSSPGWTRSSLEVDDFRPGDQVGLLCGRLSGDLICVDLDSAIALERADLHLPATKMISGRPGKPRSHRYYRVVDIPLEFTASPTVAGGIGGPRIRHFQGAGIDLIGTGGQAVEPPSLHPSGEFRIWHEFGEPTLMDCWTLYEITEFLARECGYEPR